MEVTAAVQLVRAGVFTRNAHPFALATWFEPLDKERGTSTVQALHEHEQCIFGRVLMDVAPSVSRPQQWGSSCLSRAESASPPSGDLPCLPKLTLSTHGETQVSHRAAPLSKSLPVALIGESRGTDAADRRIVEIASQ
jgi:hypothetical protein